MAYWAMEYSVPEKTQSPPLQDSNTPIGAGGFE